MIVTREIGDENLAKVYIGKIGGHAVEFAESVQPPLLRAEKWVLIVSCLFGCPVKCLMCDAGQAFRGKLTKGQVLEQIDHMVLRRFPDRKIPVKKFKIQFARRGEPALNPAVLDALEELPSLYDAPGLLPVVSTVGPKGCEGFFKRLASIKNRLYKGGRFQLQFSIHTSDREKRDKLIPIPKMDFDEIARYGAGFYRKGDRKITLNFIVMENFPIDPAVVRQHFDPEHFLIKLTPLNPTGKARSSGLTTKLDPGNPDSVSGLIQSFQDLGYDTILSIGETGENAIGSNCGQFISSADQ